MLKRVLDIVIASVALVLLSPLYFYVAYRVRKNLGSPVLFRQVRPGLHGKPFEMIKFRTMTDERDSEGNLLPNEQRLPKFGKMLRATSLDEMPELWNVIKGDMSIVGPRPLLMDYLPLYNKEQAKRHNVRPGMTGYAQVNGRNSISWEEKFKLDTWYVENQSIWLDFKIMFQTVRKVLVKEGINQSEEVTMTRFIGNKKDEQ
ncbi:sugar transferase [Acinetobacter schindleri]|uniref:sugar transferase n=1 Tax=Acinetobacter schindleri TaxID=108981 RepID=UPI002811039A|nr:sugar transferase [Acinetobacter schindleri]